MGTYDAIVIGGGFGGLVSAALLSKLGKRVLLLEKYPKNGTILSRPTVCNTRGAPRKDPNALESVAANTPATTKNPAPNNAWLHSVSNDAFSICSRLWAPPHNKICAA